MNWFHSLYALCVLILLSACVGTSSVNQFRVLHHSQAVDKSKQGTEIALVEREHGGFIAITSKRLLYFDNEFKFEKAVRFKGKYTGFGIVQGPDGLWFAGYEWWSWNYGVAHKMNFEVHAMPLGEREPTYTWQCKNCSVLFAVGVGINRTDALFARLLNEKGHKLAVFDIRNGDQHIVDNVAKIPTALEVTNPNDFDYVSNNNPGTGREYTSDAWWRYAYSMCLYKSRLLQGRMNTRDMRCVEYETPNSEISWTRVGFANDFENVRSQRGFMSLNTWDVAKIADTTGFSDVLGFYSYPSNHCDDYDHQSINGSEPNSKRPSEENSCTQVIAVVTGSKWSCAHYDHCETVTGIFDLKDSGQATLIDLVGASAWGTVRLSDGKILVAVGRDILVYDPPD